MLKSKSKTPPTSKNSRPFKKTADKTTKNSAVKSADKSKAAVDGIKIPPDVIASSVQDYDPREIKGVAKKGASTPSLAAATNASPENALGDIATEMAVGHDPDDQLSPQDYSLFKAFQSNLLSLISHELRTPLMGILNSLSMLDEPEEMGIPKEDLIRMARNNAQRLHRTLAELLDLAAIESGTFHARLREMDFSKTIRSRVSMGNSELKDLGLQLQWDEKPTPPLLADPQRVGRAIDLCLQAITPRAVPLSTLEIRISPAQVEFWFQVKDDLKDAWTHAWTEAEAGYQGGVATAGSAFAGVLQSEQAFLTRKEEGLGSEFILIHEIMRLHKGEFSERTKEIRGVTQTALVLRFPEVSSEEGLRSVLTSRAYDVSTELKSVALVLVAVPPKVETAAFAMLIKSHLFRTSDAVYPVPERRQVGLVLDDCRPEDVPHLLDRLITHLGTGYGDLLFGSAHCPSDGLDPSILFDLASERLGETSH